MGADVHVILLEEIRPEHASLVGRKAEVLATLMQAGFPVPAGFAVTSAARDAYLRDANLSNKLTELLDDLDFNDATALKRASGLAVRSIAELDDRRPCPNDVCAIYERFGGGSVAVRSSVTGDDDDGPLSAGSPAAFLNVSGVDELWTAIRACWASAFQPEALHYRAQCGDRNAAAIAVFVQRMVQSGRAGTASTIDPLSHEHDTIVIEAVYGLGAAHASGQVTPDMYAVDTASLAVLRRTVVDQPRELVHAAATTDSVSHNEWRAIPAERRTRPKLNDAEIARLAEIVRRIERQYETPQSIAWVEENGEFHVVGSRPVTTLAHTH